MAHKSARCNGGPKPGKPRLLLAPSGAHFESGFQLVKYPHPCDASKMGLFAYANDTLFELQTMGRKRPGSLFIGQEVVSADTTFVAGFIDPLFLIIPLLTRARTSEEDPAKFVMQEVNTLVEDQILRQKCLKTVLEQVCETREIMDRLFARLDVGGRFKTWLEKKLRKTAEAIIESGKKSTYIPECCFRMSSSSSMSSERAGGSCSSQNQGKGNNLNFSLDVGKAVELAADFLAGYLVPQHQEQLLKDVLPRVREQLVPLTSGGDSGGAESSGVAGSAVHGVGSLKLEEAGTSGGSSGNSFKRPGEDGGGGAAASGAQPAAAKKPKAAAKKAERVMYKDPNQLSIFDLMKRHNEKKK